MHYLPCDTEYRPRKFVSGSLIKSMVAIPSTSNTVLMIVIDVVVVVVMIVVVEVVVVVVVVMIVVVLVEVVVVVVVAVVLVSVIVVALMCSGWGLVGTRRKMKLCEK